MNACFDHANVDSSPGLKRLGPEPLPALGAANATTG